MSCPAGASPPAESPATCVRCVAPNNTRVSWLTAEAGGWGAGYMVLVASTSSVGHGSIYPFSPQQLVTLHSEPCSNSQVHLRGTQGRLEDGVSGV